MQHILVHEHCSEPDQHPGGYQQGCHAHFQRLKQVAWIVILLCSIHRVWSGIDSPPRSNDESDVRRAVQEKGFGVQIAVPAVVDEVEKQADEQWHAWLSVAVVTEVPPPLAVWQSQRVGVDVPLVVIAVDRRVRKQIAAVGSRCLVLYLALVSAVPSTYLRALHTERRTATAPALNHFLVGLTFT